MVKKIVVWTLAGLGFALGACAAPQPAVSTPPSTTAQADLQRMRASEGVTTEGESLVIVGCHVALQQDTGKQLAEAQAFNALLGTCPSGKAMTMGIRHQGFVWAEGMACVKMTIPKVGFECRQ